MKPNNNSKNSKGKIPTVPEWIKSPITFLGATITLILGVSSLAAFFLSGFLLQIVAFFTLSGLALMFLGIDYKREKFDHSLISKRLKNLVDELRFRIESKIRTKLEKIANFIFFGAFGVTVIYFSYGFLVNIIILLWMSVRDVVRLSFGSYPLSDHYLRSIGVVILFLAGINMIFIWIVSSKLASVYRETRNIRFWEVYFSEYITKRINQDWVEMWAWLDSIQDNFERFYRYPVYIEPELSIIHINLRSHDSGENVISRFVPKPSEEDWKKSFLISINEIKNLRDEFCVGKYSCVDGIRKVDLNVFTRRAEAVLDENAMFFCSVLNRYLAERVFQVDTFCDAQNGVIQKVEVNPANFLSHHSGAEFT